MDHRHGEKNTKCCKNQYKETKKQQKRHGLLWAVVQLHYNYNYNYTPLHSTTLHYSTLHYIRLDDTAP